MRISAETIISLAVILLSLGIPPADGQQFEVWGSQREGTGMTGPVSNGNSIVLTTPAQIVGVSQETESFTVFLNGQAFVTVRKGQNLTGFFPPGRYTLRTDIGSARIRLNASFQAGNTLLWGRQNALVTPQTEGNVVVLNAPMTIIDVTYDGTQGMGLFALNLNRNRAFFHYTPRHNTQNPGPKVVDLTGAVVGKSLVGLTLPAGVWELVPGREPVDGIVYAQVILAPGAGTPAPVAGWQPVFSGGNSVDIGADDICISAMRHGTGFATKRRPYDFSRDYTVAFDFQLREKDNHWLVLYSDTFVHLHIDWGTDLFFLGPSNTKIMNMEVGRWYHVEVTARPGRKSFDIDIDGNRVKTATHVTPGSLDTGPGRGTSGTDGALGEWIYVGDFQNTTYNRGSACWKNIALTYTPAVSNKAPAHLPRPQ